MRKVVGVLGVFASLVVVGVVDSPASAQPGDRVLQGTITVDWGPSAPLTGPLASGQAHVRVKACLAGTGSTCLADPNGWVAAAPVGFPGNPGYFATFTYSLAIDSTASYVVGASARFEMGDPLAVVSASRGRAVLQPSAGTVQFVGPGTDPVTLNWPSTTVPGTLDASYYQISGNITYAGDNDFHGVGACPAGSPLVGNACAGIAFTWARASQTYLLNLPANAWRAAGFAIPTGSNLPALGIVNLLDLQQPPTYTTWQLSLDFSADLLNVNQQIENGAPNGGDGNFDGTVDSLQTSVASMKSAVDQSYVTIDAHGIDVTSGAAQPLVALLAPPPTAQFPNGIFSFTVGPVAVGASVPIDITFHSPPPPGSVFLKFVGGAWSAYSFTDVTVLGRPYTIRVVLDDGGPGDHDGQPNGYITDPFAQAIPIPYVASKLAVSAQGGVASVEFAVTYDGVTLEQLPPGSTLTYKCGGSLRTPLTASAGPNGTLVSHFPIGRKATCVVQLLIPMSFLPTLEQSASVRTR